MTFQNTTLLVALAAIGIPIALHLIARKEPKQVVFPSVRLLTQRFETNRSKVRIRRWWLLALRIAAVAVVALALAQPVIAGSLSLTWSTIGILSLVGIALLAMATVAAAKPHQKTLVRSLLAVAGFVLLAALGWGGYTLASGTKPEIDDSTPVALAVVVDNTPLAAWRNAQEDHLEQLRSSARQLMLAANRDSRIALIDRSSTPAAFALDLAGALSKVDVLEPLEMAAPLESRIEAAARLLQTSEISSRQLVILTSMPESSFADDASGLGLSTLIRDSGIRVTVWDMGGFEGTNRQLSIPTLSDNAPAPDATVTVAAVLSLQESSSSADAAGDANGAADTTTTDVEEGVRAFDEPNRTSRVTAECVLFPNSASLPVVRDGQIIRPEAKPVDRINVELTPNGDVELQMTLPPLPVGLHQGAIRLVGQDALAIDDAGYFSIEVLPPSRLLLVSDQPEEAEEIAWAVSAPVPVDDPSSQYAIEQIGYGDLAASRLADFDGVMLLDPPQTAFYETELERYREAGGSILVAVGDALGQGQVDLRGWVDFQRRWRVTKPGTFLEISAASHPALVSLASNPGGVPFQDFRVRQYWQADPSNEGQQVLMRYAGTDHPALIERAADGASLDGEDRSAATGRVLVLTTPIPALAAPNRAWNDLLSADDPWPAFVLIRDLTRYLTGRNAQTWTSSVGTPVSIPVKVQGDASSGPRRLQWFPPVGSTPIPIDLPESDNWDDGQSIRIVIGRPEHSGVNWIRGGQPGLGFSVNLPRDRLSTTRLDPSKLSELVGDDAFRLIESFDQMDWTSTDGSQVVSLWSPIMLLGLLVFLLEQILGNRFYRRSSSGGKTSKGTRTAA